jgi:hypothetical protein
LGTSPYRAGAVAMPCFRVVGGTFAEPRRRGSKRASRLGSSVGFSVFHKRNLIWDKIDYNSVFSNIFFYFFLSRSTATASRKRKNISDGIKIVSVSLRVTTLQTNSARRVAAME